MRWYCNKCGMPQPEMTHRPPRTVGDLDVVFTFPNLCSECRPKIDGAGQLNPEARLDIKDWERLEGHYSPW